jgi:hypothetical protein
MFDIGLKSLKDSNQAKEEIQVRPLNIQGRSLWDVFMLSAWILSYQVLIWMFRWIRRVEINWEKMVL